MNTYAPTRGSFDGNDMLEMEELKDDIFTGNLSSTSKAPTYHNTGGKNSFKTNS